MVLALHELEIRTSYLPPSEIDSIIYVGNVLLKLAEDGEFKFETRSETRVGEYERSILPVVKNWALVVFGVMITSFLVTISSAIFISRMFPSSKLLGEDFIARMSTGSCNSWVHIERNEQES